MSVLVNLMVMLGMLVVVPAGLRLIDAEGLASIRRMWPVFAVPGAVALWLPRSTAAALLAGVYALGTLALAAQAPRRLMRSRSPNPAEVAVLTALVTPAVASLALVAERSGHELLGFDLPTLALTVPHFHYAGFAAALVAGLVCRATSEAVDQPPRAGRRSDNRFSGPLGRFAALSVPLGTLLVLTGYFLNDWAELLGALVLTAGMWSVALLTWREIRTEGQDRWTRALLGISSAVLAATMLLALSWALGEASGLPHPTLTWMAATHGLGNALGFALCSVLAWQRLDSPGPTAARPAAGRQFPKETTP